MVDISYSRYHDLLVKNNTNSYQVSKDTGIHQSTLSDWKTGRSCPKSDKLYVLASYFGVEIEYFLEDSEGAGRKSVDADKTERKIATASEVTSSNNMKNHRQAGTGSIQRVNTKNLIKQKAVKKR